MTTTLKITYIESESLLQALEECQAAGVKPVLSSAGFYSHNLLYSATTDGSTYVTVEMVDVSAEERASGDWAVFEDDPGAHALAVSNLLSGNA